MAKKTRETEQASNCSNRLDSFLIYGKVTNSKRTLWVTLALRLSTNGTGIGMILIHWLDLGDDEEEKYSQKCWRGKRELDLRDDEEEKVLGEAEDEKAKGEEGSIGGIY
ncbi:hypothetical protein SLE2022_368490 [Rubroshorea leprosula]